VVKRTCLTRSFGWLAAVSFLCRGVVWAGEGTEGASFLNIPVGARPAALGSAYSALASDAYAPTWNPGGLGKVDGTQLAGQHLSYLESIYYEYAGFVHPLGHGRAFGASIQYLGSGPIDGVDLAGNSIGEYSSHYGAYSLAYGQTLNDRLSVGVTGKIISAKISDVSATAYAFDIGSLYQVNQRLSVAGVLTNVGTKLTFIDQSDSLPLAFRLGAAYQTTRNLNITAECVYRQTGLASFHTGLEWNPMPALSLRAGYRTDTLAGLSPIAGFSTGIGLHVWGQEFSYAWVPMGELGSTQYFSLVMRFGGSKAASPNLSTPQAVRRAPAPVKHQPLASSRSELKDLFE
jgi:hypothetical protein